MVAETLNLGALNGYRTGGTLHLITNNQVGFTTDMEDARSTRYAIAISPRDSTSPSSMSTPTIAEACLSAVRLSMAYRDRFHQDVVIDLVGYRRHGHNEGDEPAYTQPLMYERIKNLPPCASSTPIRWSRPASSPRRTQTGRRPTHISAWWISSRRFKASMGAGPPAPKEPPKSARAAAGQDVETALAPDFLKL